MRKDYFFVASVLLLLLSLIAFSDNLLTDVGQESNSDPKFIIHGLSLFAWFIILVIQTGFIRKANYAAHMRLGRAGFVAAGGVVLSTLYVFYSIYRGWDAMPFNAKANRILMPSFALFVTLACLNRRNGNIHKRYIYVGTLYLLEPILSRVAGHLHLNPFVFTPVAWNAFFISLFIYDWLTLRKIHGISWLGFGWFYAIWAIAIVT